MAPRIAVLASFDQAAPAVGGDILTARGYRLDLAAGLTIGGAPALTTLVDSATLRVVLPSIDTSLCRGGAYVPAALGNGIVRTRGVLLQRPGELTLAPGEVVRLGPSRGGCLRLAPVPGAEYVLMYADTRPIISARRGLFPSYTTERFNFAVGFDRWEGGPAMSAPLMQAPTSAGVAAPIDVVRPSAPTAAAPSDAIESRATPWGVGDRASIAVQGVYESASIVSVSGPFVALVLDSEPLRTGELEKYEAAIRDVQGKVVPMLRAAFSDRTPVTSAGSGQFVIALSLRVAQGHGGLFFGHAAAVAPALVGVPPIAHELAHAWQDRFNRDHCAVDVPFACWVGSQWAVEGGAEFLSQEAWRRVVGAPLLGADAAIYSSRLFTCCLPLHSVVFGDGYGSASWFLRETLARAVAGGASYDDAIAAVSRGSLEGWDGVAPQRFTPLGGLTNRLTALLGVWDSEEAFESTVWGLGMDETPSSIHQHLAAVDYHIGRVGTIEMGQELAGDIAGDTFGHVRLDDRGEGGAYRYSVGTDGIVWAVGRVR